MFYIRTNECSLSPHVIFTAFEISRIQSLTRESNLRYLRYLTECRLFFCLFNIASVTYAKFYTEIFVPCKFTKIKNKSFFSSSTDRKEGRIKQTNLNTSTYIGVLTHKVWMFKFSPFLRSRGHNFFYYGTVNKQTEVLNDIEI